MFTDVQFSNPKSIHKQFKQCKSILTQVVGLGLLLFFEAGSHGGSGCHQIYYKTGADFELLIFLYLLSKCWDYRRVSPHSAIYWLTLKL